MSLASKLSLPQLHRTSAPNKAGRRQLCRQPIHARPSLEPLEERTLLDASSGLIGGANNLAFNGAAGSSGIILPMAAIMPDASAGTGLAFANAGVAAALPATASLAAQSIAGTLGFGSGTDPNAPWQPDAYNLGLANHQYGYPSMTDVGFTAVPPWHHPGG
jgi:hypothetical protein